MVKTNMSSNGPSLGPDPNSDSRKLSCRSETAVCLQHRGGEPERGKGADGMQLFALDCIAEMYMLKRTECLLV